MLKYVIYVIFANKGGIYDHTRNIFWMNIYWRIQKPGYVINYDVVRSKNMVCILLSRSQNSIFARKKSKNLHFWRNFVTGGENLHFWRISSFSASDEFLSACIYSKQNLTICRPRNFRLFSRILAHNLARILDNL